MLDSRWFPAVESQQVVGRVIEVDKPWTAGSIEAKRQMYRKVPVLESKVAGQHDLAHQEIKEWNRDEICGRFPGAWEAYEASKGSAAPVVTAAPDGMPIDRADFVPRAKLAWLKDTGFQTVEQLANISDAQVQAMGTGASTWRKKAKLLLSTKG